MPPETEAATICEMCRKEYQHALATYAGLQCCKSCREGDFDPALAAWGIRGISYDGERRASRYNSRDFIADVILPTVVNVDALLRKERLDSKLVRLTGEQGAASDASSFDKKVWVEEIEGEMTRELLKDPAVQGAVVEAVGVAHWIKLSRERIRLYQPSSNIRFKPERDLERLARAAVALGVAIERWARGAPGEEAMREGCRPRLDGEWPKER